MLRDTNLLHHILKTFLYGIEIPPRKRLQVVRQPGHSWPTYTS